MSIAGIKKMVRCYNLIKKLSSYLEQIISKTLSESEYIYIKGVLIKYRLFGSIDKMVKLYLKLSDIINCIDNVLNEVTKECKECVTQVLIYNKSYINASMNLYMSEATLRRNTDHFIGLLYLCLNKDRSLMGSFKTMYFLFYKNN